MSSTVNRYDFHAFISHASEDKDDFVRPLAEHLRGLGLKIWYDEFSLGMGDNLRRSIERGLARSRFGIVVLSPAFFNKPWPERELDGLVALEMSDGTPRILPIWHNVDYTAVVRHSAPLAGVIAGNSNKGVESLAKDIVRAISRRDATMQPYYTSVIEDSVVDIVGFARQSGGVIEGAYFKRCKIVGPAVLLFNHPNLALIKNNFTGDQFWPVEFYRPYVGSIPFRNSGLEDCTFDLVGFAAHQTLINQVIYASYEPGEEMNTEEGLMGDRGRKTEGGEPS